MNERILPSYPLFLKDPYFSIWSNEESLNDNDTVFWTGDKKRTYGIIKANDKCYSFLGNIGNIEKLEQKELEITTFRTMYAFECSEFELKVSFFSPLPITDYEIWSCPVCYLEYEVVPKVTLRNVSISISLNEEWCYNGKEQKAIRGDVYVLEDKEVAYFGCAKQHIFNQTGDRTSADWGYYYLLADSCYYHTIDDFSNLENFETIHTDAGEHYITGVEHYDSIENITKGKILVAFDDLVSVNYYGEFLRGYYFSNYKTIMDALQFSLNEYDRVCRVCNEVEKDLMARTEKYGTEYQLLLNASYRQTLAAHKLVKDNKGRLLLLSKECGSGGCVATVDVTYPTMPMLLLFQPELVKASIEPIFDFAKMDVWEDEFAPHDAGMYPFCCGQFYGLKRRDEGKYGRNLSYALPNGQMDTLPPYYLYPKGSRLYDLKGQMPVEECADMILICALYLKCSGDKAYVRSNFFCLEKWCEYLVKHGLEPNNQLCTDDFLQHMDKNVNLAIKAIVAIYAFSDIEKEIYLRESKWLSIARKRAEEIKNAFTNRHMPLSFDSDDSTYSVKYNLLPAKLLGLSIFSEEQMEREIQICMQHCEKFGFPLDNRFAYTKTDWMMWMAALSNDMEVQKKIIGCICTYLKESVDRVPFADLYDCTNSKSTDFGFTNRTVQGSMFILLLRDMLFNKREF